MLAWAQSALPLADIRLPPGFSISVVARVPNARAMTFGPGGTLFVGSAAEGSVYAVRLPPGGGDGSGEAATPQHWLRSRVKPATAARRAAKLAKSKIKIKHGRKPKGFTGPAGGMTYVIYISKNNPGKQFRTIKK